MSSMLFHRVVYFLDSLTLAVWASIASKVGRF